MEQFNSEFERYQRARKQVNEIKSFYGNLLAYIFANGFMLYINLKYSPEYLWFFWPLLGWGLGLLFHAMKAFSYTPFLGKGWEERKLKQFMDQDKKNGYGQ